MVSLLIFLFQDVCINDMSSSIDKPDPYIPSDVPDGIDITHALEGVIRGAMQPGDIGEAPTASGISPRDQRGARWEILLEIYEDLKSELDGWSFWGMKLGYCLGGGSNTIGLAIAIPDLPTDITTKIPDPILDRTQKSHLRLMDEKYEKVQDDEGSAYLVRVVSFSLPAPDRDSHIVEDY